jgi:hypothetical protein
VLAGRAGVVLAAVVLVTGALWLGGPSGEPAESPVATGLDGRAATSSPTPTPEDGAGGPVADVSAAADGGTASEAPGGAADVDSAEAWTARLGELYQRRAEAFRTGAPELLDEVHTGGSPLLAADRATVEAFLRAGETVRGFTPSVVRVAVVDGGVGEGRVTLDVVDTWPAYEVVAADEPEGRDLRTVDARGEAQVRMTLVDGDRGWRIDAAERTG